MPHFTKKPVTIEARKFNGSISEMQAIYQWVEANTLGSFEPMAVINGEQPWPESGVTIDPRDGRMIIATLEGGHWVNLGDFIIRGVQGEFYPCKPDIFTATYDPENEEPEGPVDHFAEAERLLVEAEKQPLGAMGEMIKLAQQHLVLDEIARARGIGVPTIKPNDEFGDIDLPTGTGAVIRTPDGTIWIRNGADYPNDKQLWKTQGSGESWQTDEHFETLRFKVLSAGVVL